MRTVDIIYRCSASQTAIRPLPSDSNAALLRLEQGNKGFAALLDHMKDESGLIQQVIAVDPRDLGLGLGSGSAGSVGPGWGNGKAPQCYSPVRGPPSLAAEINIDAARETQRLIEAEGGTCQAVACDVTQARAGRRDGRCLPHRVRRDRYPTPSRLHR
jgi:hypothetical protein